MRDMWKTNKGTSGNKMLVLGLMVFCKLYTLWTIFFNTYVHISGGSHSSAGNRLGLNLCRSLINFSFSLFPFRRLQI